MPQVTMEHVERHMTPARCLEISFALYVLSDRRIKGTDQERLATSMITDYESLTAAEGSPEWWFLTNIKGTILSYVRNIRRKRDICDAEIETARQEMATAIADQRSGKWLPVEGPFHSSPVA